MKLQSQLTAAFTALLLVIMAVAWYVIYSLILDLLIQDEQRQLKQTGELLVNVLNEQYGRADIQRVNGILQDQDLQMFMYDRKHDQVLLSTMSNKVASAFFRNNDFSDTKKNQWEYGKEQFVTSRIIFLPEESGLELILLTPISDLQIVQQSFFSRIFLIFIIGAFAAVLISYYLTKTLVTPLSKLKRQLKKIEKRQFDDIEHIKATGEIKEVADSVYEMANELQRYMSSQQTFFQNASHELKTPLMTIQGYAEGIKDGIFTEKEAEKGLEVMVSEVNRLKAIINEMILLAKLDSEPSVYEPVKLNAAELINQVIDRAIPFVNEKGIRLHHEVDESIILFADEEKLLRALLNIVFNGIRHTNSQIEINVFKRNRRIFITIADDGEGISEEVTPNIFHRFVKGKNGETGLGLAIARAIIEQSGGKITAGKSKLGGAEFEVNLPERNGE
ncbi:sensor histidine kinase [Oceanobacillus arenosus]|uniref:histidine kinase n=1 Tax=Oceanobacillus arenosus TaxID=1229153 RepID=A0A3D8PPH0_9BACI|nr:HAMP domain-containing sensor histidine kinase [Oceanobacillus arenosus]RDW17148.1 sensor histidine kinase [Oceanobacillus arenosus]